MSKHSHSVDVAWIDVNHISYEAAEDNELSFQAGDRITDIEAASEDWWQGKDKDGNVGLFPGTSFALFYIFHISCSQFPP